MAGKRQATYDLNHDNWDLDEEPEDRGSFRTATEEELKNRVIKKAKRKIVPGTGNNAVEGGCVSSSVFGEFSGFGKPASNTTLTTPSPFSFLSKIPAIAGANCDIVSCSTTTSSTLTYSCGSGSAAATTVKSTPSSNKSLPFGSSADTAASINALSETTINSMLSEYHKKLSSLNQALCEWIKTRIGKNPVCILSPIFKDYENYLAEIENEKTTDGAEKPVSASGMGCFKFSINNSNNIVSTKTTRALSLTSETKPNGFSFGLEKSEDIPSVKPPTTRSFSFGFSPSATMSTATTSSSFSFGNTSNNSSQLPTPTKTFFHASDTLFSFGNIKSPNESGAGTSGCDPNDEDEEPPKNEFKMVVEDDAVYSKKCKVFVKKDGNFVDKGVGTLYMKPIEFSGKTQLLVRADTNLGNILVNFILNSAIPAQRMGKNNVMMVCLPTPDVEKPTTILLRVKTSEEADELMENIGKYKK